MNVAEAVGVLNVAEQRRTGLVVTRGGPRLARERRHHADAIGRVDELEQRAAHGAAPDVVGEAAVAGVDVEDADGAVATLMDGRGEIASVLHTTTEVEDEGTHRPRERLVPRRATTCVARTFGGEADATTAVPNWLAAYEGTGPRIVGVTRVTAR